MNNSEPLKDASLCRLCGNISHNGSYLFSGNENHSNLAVLINKYLPLKIENDGKYPDTICSDCELQLSATKLFFDLIVQGQSQLKLIYENIENESRVTKLKSEDNKTPKLNRYEIESGNGEKFFIEIVGDATSDDGPVYSTEHEMVAEMNVLNKEKKKRGRPKKQNKVEIEKTEEKGPQAEEIKTHVIFKDNGKRQRKIPARFTETVQGKELDEILKKEGIEVHEVDKNNIEPEEEEKLIGRIESKDSKDGELIYIKRNSVRYNDLTNDIQRKRKTRRRYKCPHCVEQFRNFPRLRSHINENHDIDELNNKKIDDVEIENETFKTSLDEIGIKMENNTMENMINFLNEQESSAQANEDIKMEENENSSVVKEKFQCDICDKMFSTKQNLRIHLEGVHEKKKPFVCSICNMAFPYSKTLKIHQLTHKRSIFHCEECDKSFNHPSSLMYHRNAEHSNGRRFVCTKCNKTFKHRALLHRHQLVHSEDRPYRCTICPSAFKTKGNLLTHHARHSGVKNYACKECGQHFAHKTSLNLHVRWHKGEKPFKCGVCQKSFSQKGNLLEHERIHTGEKPFKCESCGRSFTTSSQYKLHSKRHTGEKPWTCELCPKKFLHKNSWEMHKRAHMNDRPYKCQICNKGFVTPNCLKKHMRFHNAPPFYCSICLRGFTDSSNLKKHLKTHERKSSSKSNETQQVSLLKSNAENNLFYVYYPTLKNTKDDDMVVDTTAIDTTAAATIDVVQSSVELDVTEDQNALEETIQYQQLVDQEGNPLSLNTQDGQRINVVTSLSDGQEKLQGLLPDGTLISIDLNDTKVNGIERLVDTIDDEVTTLTPLVEGTTLAPLVEGGTNVVPQLIEGGANVSHLLFDGNMTFLSETIDKQSESNILVSDQPICFVTYNSHLGDL